MNEPKNSKPALRWLLLLLESIAGLIFFCVTISILFFLFLTAVIYFIPTELHWKTVSVDPNFTKLVDVIVWPFVFLVFGMFALLSSKSKVILTQILNSVSAVKLGSYEVNFTEQGAKLLKRDIETSLNDFSSQGRLAYDKASKSVSLKECAARVSTDVRNLSRELKMPNENGIELHNLRIAVHIVDVLFEESLYQLTDYYPSNDGSDRRFSIRFGAIGLAWREGESTYWNLNDPANTEEELVRKWGMTKEEAIRSAQRPVGICIILQKEKERQGILYIDSKNIEYISSKTDHKSQNEDIERLMKDIEELPSITDLTRSLKKINDQIKPAATYLNIHS
jgi:hypothetical protein